MHVRADIALPYQSCDMLHLIYARKKLVKVATIDPFPCQRVRSRNERLPSLLRVAHNVPAIYNLYMYFLFDYTHAVLKVIRLVMMDFRPYLKVSRIVKSSKSSGKSSCD